VDRRSSPLPASRQSRDLEEALLLPCFPCRGFRFFSFKSGLNEREHPFSLGRLPAALDSLKFDSGSLLQTFADRLESPLFIREFPRLKLGIKELSVGLEFETATP